MHKHRTSPYTHTRTYTLTATRGMPRVQGVGCLRVRNHVVRGLLSPRPLRRRDPRQRPPRRGEPPCVPCQEACGAGGLPCCHSLYDAGVLEQVCLFMSHISVASCTVHMRLCVCACEARNAAGLHRAFGIVYVYACVWCVCVCLCVCACVFVCMCLCV